MKFVQFEIQNSWPNYFHLISYHFTFTKISKICFLSVSPFIALWFQERLCISNECPDRIPRKFFQFLCLLHVKRNFLQISILCTFTTHIPQEKRKFNFLFENNEWTTNGRVLFNMNPDEAILQHKLETVD